jgi:hypothetical protein
MALLSGRDLEHQRQFPSIANDAREKIFRIRKVELIPGSVKIPKHI